MKIDYVKVFTLGMAFLTAAKNAAEDGKVTVREIIEIGAGGAMKMAELLDILDKPIIKLDPQTRG